MSATFDVQISELKAVHDMPEMWNDTIFRNILEEVDFDEVDEIHPSELREMTVMALQDMKPEKAAESVLTVLVSTMTAGRRQNLAHDMKGQRMWEEFANPLFHAQIFGASVLLHAAFPRNYFQPEITSLTLDVTATNAAATRLLTQPTSPLVVRLIAAGMNEQATLHRLYGEALASGPFVEAATIIWHLKTEAQTPEKSTWSFYASWYWARALQGKHNFSAEIR